MRAWERKEYIIYRLVLFVVSYRDISTAASFSRLVMLFSTPSFVLFIHPSVSFRQLQSLLPSNFRPVYSAPSFSKDVAHCLCFLTDVSIPFTSRSYPSRGSLVCSPWRIPGCQIYSYLIPVLPISPTRVFPVKCAAPSRWQDPQIEGLSLPQITPDSVWETIMRLCTQFDQRTWAAGALVNDLPENGDWYGALWDAVSWKAPGAGLEQKLAINNFLLFWPCVVSVCVCVMWWPQKVHA